MRSPDSTEDEDLMYRVVVNHEQQYSIWPHARELPPGWTDTGTSGSKQHCLSHIERIWTDMRPLSLRERLDGARHTQTDNST
ncbi:MAG TPA: MbtH family protein [Kofleriaceae bacterium]|nr:MbtH family protein [Kofleriaceae bacterium]